jgi:hypothetical protein
MFVVPQTTTVMLLIELTMNESYQLIGAYLDTTNKQHTWMTYKGVAGFH